MLLSSLVFLSSAANFKEVVGLLQEHREVFILLGNQWPQPKCLIVFPSTHWNITPQVANLITLMFHKDKPARAPKGDHASHGKPCEVPDIKTPPLLQNSYTKSQLPTVLCCICPSRTSKSGQMKLLYTKNKESWGSEPRVQIHKMKRWCSNVLTKNHLLLWFNSEPACFQYIENGCYMDPTVPQVTLQVMLVFKYLVDSCWLDWKCCSAN